MEFDVRNHKEPKYDLIRFHSGAIEDAYVADTIEPTEDYGLDDCIAINETGNDDSVGIVSVEHARNLIKALEKAIELGWLK